MSKTYRKIKNLKKCLRNPKTFNYKKALCRTREELIEYTGINSLKVYNNVVSNYDDLFVSGKKEYKTKEDRIIKKFNNVFPELKKYRIQSYFNSNKNKIELSALFNRLNIFLNKHKLPFYFSYKDRSYPIEILHNS